MNLNANPTKEELRQLLAQGNDRAGHHVLWVDRQGDVHLSTFPVDLTPSAIEQSHADMQLRYETFQKGNE